MDSTLGKNKIESISRGLRVEVNILYCLAFEFVFLSENLNPRINCWIFIKMDFLPGIR